MIRPGDSGPAVVALQERLRELGYGLLEPDGSYGPATQQAVWALQKAAGLSRDGIIGPETQTRLDEGYRPARAGNFERGVEIDLDRQILLVIDHGTVSRIFNISSGNGEKFVVRGRTYHATTPRGSFTVYATKEGTHSSTLGLGEMYRPRYFTGGIALHGSPSVPAYPASHGCVRIANPAADWLFDTWGMPVGTPVLVH